MPAYFNSCLSGTVDANDPTLVSVINDIQTQNNPNGEIRYEFYQIPYTEFADKDGNEFADSQACADYITQEGNVLGVSDVGTSLNGITVNFRLDQTSTSVIMDNGAAFGVNTIKAVPNADGTIHIHAIGAGVPEDSDEPDDHKYYEQLEVNNVQINGSAVSGGINDVCNALNELFTVGAFESVVISDPFSTMIADVAGVAAGYTLEGTNAVDPIGDDVFANSTTGNYAGLLSTATIDQAGEYFTFDIRGEGQIGFGLVHTQGSYDAGYYSGNSNYADPTTFAVSNSAHYGYQFSHWFHPTPNGSWTNYGANTGVVYGPGWYSWQSQDEWLAGDPVKVRVGIDENGFIAISTLQDNDADWVLHARSSYPVPQGSEFKLGIKSSGSAARVFSAPNVHLLEPAAPTMNFRYIESPDGNYQYPLFATTDEAEYYDQNHDGTTGSGTYHSHVFVDDATNTTWYMPDTGATMDGTSAPSGTFMSNAINWTEISSLSNADLAPEAYADNTVEVNELQSVNIQVSPQDVGYTTTITDNDVARLFLTGNSLQGTAPEVTGDNVANPNDEYTFTVTRTNSYGSSTGTLTIRVVNLTAPVVVPITGFTHVTGSTALVDSDTLDDGSAVTIDDTVAAGRRFVINQSWVEANVLPALQAAGDKVYVGVANGSANWSSVDDADFDFFIRWDYSTASSHISVLRNQDGIISNLQTVNSLADSYYDYAIEVDGTDVHLIACNANDINTQPAVNDGGSFSRVQTISSYAGTIPLTLTVAVVSTQMDIATTGLSEIDTPAAPVSIITPWTKALDFSGSNEYGLQVSPSPSTNALRMQGLGYLVPANAVSGRTSDSEYARPWATAIVFQADRNSSNQHIWNSGDGAGSTDDNIYVRLDANGNLYFGWGRTGALNECRIGGVPHYSTGRYWGVYVAHNGTRLSGGNATAANLADCFDIRLMTNNGNDDFTTLGSNLSTTANWNAGSTGGRMDRSITGTFTIGGRGSNRNFHGKVASMVVTHLKLDTAMPADAEIKLMITDPKKWEDDYRIAQSVRQSLGISNIIYSPSNLYNGYGQTQIWLMGDGTSDSYANGIRNDVQPSDQNYSKLQLNSMVSNDIQTVSIQGLS